MVYLLTMRNVLWLSLALALGPFNSPPEELPKALKVVQILWARKPLVVWVPVKGLSVEKQWANTSLEALRQECDSHLDPDSSRDRLTCHLYLAKACELDPDPTGMDWCQRAKFFPLMDQCYYDSNLEACYQALLVDCEGCQIFKTSIADAIEVIGQSRVETALEVMSQTAPSKSWTLTTTIDHP